MIVVKCAKCGNYLKRHKDRCDKNDNHFCSRKCYSKEFRGPPRIPKVSASCVICGKVVYRQRSRVPAKNPTCSNVCRYELRRGKRWVPHNKISNETLLSDLNDLALKINGLPNTSTINEEWSGRSVLYARRFGSIRNAIAQCGLNKLFPRARISGITAVPFFQYSRKWDGKTVKLQGTYEVRLASLLDDIGVSWLSHGEFPPLYYTDDIGKRRKYNPDFLVPDADIYIETKGWMHESAARKMSLFASQNPDISLAILYKKDIDACEADIKSRGA